MIQIIRNVIRHGCSHRNVTFPVSGHQHCTDCGATRTYEFLTSDIGQWTKIGSATVLPLTRKKSAQAALK